MIDKRKAMFLIHTLIMDNELTLKDYYSLEIVNPVAEMLGCPNCDECGNNGCGISYFPWVSVESNECEFKNGGKRNEKY